MIINCLHRFPPAVALLNLRWSQMLHWEVIKRAQICIGDSSSIRVIIKELVEGMVLSTLFVAAACWGFVVTLVAFGDVVVMNTVGFRVLKVYFTRREMNRRTSERLWPYPMIARRRFYSKHNSCGLNESHQQVSQGFQIHAPTTFTNCISDGTHSRWSKPHSRRCSKQCKKFACLKSPPDVW